jgi:signal transduction histidine kinase
MATTPYVSRRSILTAASATLAGTALAAAAPLSLAKASASAAVLEINPDAELLRLDREHDIAWARANGHHGEWDEDEFEEQSDLARDLEFAIHDIPAQTIAGLAVKARLAAEYVTPIYPDCRILDDILTSLIEDLLRLGSVGPKLGSEWRPMNAGSDHGTV